MARAVALALIALLSGWMVSRPINGQGLDISQSIPIRDPAAPPQRGQGPPTERRIPVGSGMITGTVVSAETGRPIPNARVSLNGSAGPLGARGVAAGGVTMGIAGTAVTIPGGAVAGRAGGLQTSSVLMLSSVSRTIVTDGQGQFTFARLAAGRYSLNVNRNQYLSTTYGQKRPGGTGTTIQLSDGQQLKVSLPMTRGGVITGQVIGEDGEPMSGAQVRSLRYTMNGGVKRLQSSGYATSDDRGVYRMFGLQPGDYIVATPNTQDMMMPERMLADQAAIEQAIASGTVQPGAAPGMPATVAVPMPAQPNGPVSQPPGYLPIYYPNTPVPSNASAVHITGGDEHTGIDVQVQFVQASTIQGSISNPPPQGMAVQVSLMSDDPNADVSSLPSTRIGPDGKFTFRTVAPGKYVVLAQTVAAPQPVQFVNGAPSPTPQPPLRLEDSQRLWARATVTVEGQATLTANLTLQPGRSISGIVVFDMARPPDLTQGRSIVNLSSAPGVQSISFGQPPQAAVGPDGRFTLNGVIPGKYILRPPGTAKSAVVNGEDTLDFPLDFTGERDITDAVLTVTDKLTELSGTLTDALGKPATDFTIVVAPADERFWTPGARRIVTARTATDGRYIFRNLPPGTYLLAAVTDIESGGQYDPEFLRSLNGASMRVTLSEGEKQTQDVRVR